MFVTEQDKKILKEQGVEYDKDVPLFIENIKQIFLDVWREEFTEEIKKIKTVEDLGIDV